MTTTAGVQQVASGEQVPGGAAIQKTVAVLPLMPKSFNDITRIAEGLKDAELLPDHLRGKPADLRLILMTGVELGFTPAQAIRELYAVHGQVRESALSMVARVMQSPLCEYWTLVESTDERAVYETKRKGQPRQVRMEFTIADAKKAGLVGRESRSGKASNWDMRPKLMLRRRCQTELANEVYPDVLKGMSAREDAEEEFELEVRPSVLTPPASRAPVAPAAAPVSARGGAETAPMLERLDTPAKPAAPASAGGSPKASSGGRGAAAKAKGPAENEALPLSGGGGQVDLAPKPAEVVNFPAKERPETEPEDAQVETPAQEQEASKPEQSAAQPGTRVLIFDWQTDASKETCRKLIACKSMAEIDALSKEASALPKSTENEKASRNHVGAMFNVRRGELNR